MTLELFLRFAQLRVRERMEYRAAYLLGMFSQIINYGANYAVLFVLAHRFTTISGWTWPQITFLFSLDLFTYALGASVMYSAMMELEALIVEGRFDTILVAPLDPLLHLAARKYNIGYFAHILLSAAFLTWSLRNLDLKFGIAGFAYLALAVVSAACLQAAALLALGSIAFTAIRSSSIFNLYYTTRRFLAYPITVYGTGIQWLLTLLIPIAFINYYPAALLLNKGGAVLPQAAGWAAPIIGPCLLLGAYRLFNAAVTRYQGAGG